MNFIETIRISGATSKKGGPDPTSEDKPNPDPDPTSQDKPDPDPKPRPPGTEH